MGLLQDLLYGGKPKRWTDTQWRTFDENYSRMANGVFSWSDFKPPTNLAALTATIINLSLKSMISGGNRGLFAGYVDLLNREYLAGSRTSDILFLYGSKFNAAGYSNEQVQYIALALHDQVFPGVRKD